MSAVVALPPPLRADRAVTGRTRTGTALTMLTVYVVLLCGVPSNVTISPLGGLGRPALIWGLLLLLWWVIARLQARSVDVSRATQPARWAYLALLVMVLVSFAAAMLRGQPDDQVTVAIAAVIRLLSWGGVALVLMDGIRTLCDADRLLAWIVWIGAGLAVLGIAQFATGQSLLEWLTQVPGISVEASGAGARGAFLRPSGTATHALEYAAVICSILPLAITLGVTRAHAGRGRLPWTWIPAALIAIAALISVSRSAIIGVVVAVAASLPALPVAYRWLVAAGGVIAAIGIVAVVPGMFGTVVDLFAGSDKDPSTLSRTNALAQVPEFLAASPVIGLGFGTFLPRYYIFDNQWVLILLELGLLGLLAFVVFAFTAMWSAVSTIRRSPYSDVASLGRGIVAALLTSLVLFAFFDGLSFPMSAGMFFVLIGLAGAIRTIGAADANIRPPQREEQDA
ncbi:O-antigen ligase family protein [Microbacterium sp. JZ31]|uniref:O-antigen ligase family protein n=1 Tax=Microbacterium sp. JZ31 TaxID=1906274 RepID=UPI0019314099|nr:O-antigen ligase family protein [Microbacterium sp. JZ31]